MIKSKSVTVTYKSFKKTQSVSTVGIFQLQDYKINKIDLFFVKKPT